MIPRLVVIKTGDSARPMAKASSVSRNTLTRASHRSLARPGSNQLLTGSWLAAGRTALNRMMGRMHADTMPSVLSP